MANIAPVDASDIYKTIKILVDQGIERRDHVNQFLRSIYRVPKTLRDVSDKCYTPRIVSIGPFHHEEENLKGVEVQKMTYMLDLFRRFNSPWEQTLKVCLDLVQDKIVQIRACYEGETMKTYDDHVFAQMMVVDACFIIELINWSNHPNCKSRSFVDNKLLTLYVKHDLLLLENQIPFFVLDDIFECTIRKFERRSCLTKLILTFLKDMNPYGTDLPLDNVEEDNNDHDHILGLFQKCYWDSHAMPSVLSKTPLKSAEEFSKAISYSVTELALAGVKFKPNRDPKRVLEMKFKSSR